MVIPLGVSSPTRSSSLPAARCPKASCRDGPSLTAYLALLRPGFTEPRPLPDARWALTHPFTLTAFSRRRRFAFCCTVRRMQLTPYAPRRYLAICPMEPGLSSEHGRGHEGSFPCFATIRPVTSVPRNISHATNTTPSTTPTQRMTTG